MRYFLGLGSTIMFIVSACSRILGLKVLFLQAESSYVERVWSWRDKHGVGSVLCGRHLPPPPLGQKHQLLHLQADPQVHWHCLERAQKDCHWGTLVGTLLGRTRTWQKLGRTPSIRCGPLNRFLSKHFYAGSGCTVRWVFKLRLLTKTVKIKLVFM